MRTSILFLFLAIFLYACGGTDSEATGDTSSGAPSAGTGTSAPQASAPAADGEKIYKQYCVACHGLYGDMGASGAFNLTTSTLSVEERVQVITNGRVNAETGAAMTPFEALLDPEEIQAVADYTMTLTENATN